MYGMHAEIAKAWAEHLNEIAEKERTAAAARRGRPGRTPKRFSWSMRALLARRAAAARA